MVILWISCGTIVAICSKIVKHLYLLLVLSSCVTTLDELVARCMTIRHFNTRLIELRFREVWLGCLHWIQEHEQQVSRRLNKVLSIVAR